MKQSHYLPYAILTMLLAIIAVGCQQDLIEREGGSTSLLRFRCDSIATRSAGYTQSGAEAIRSMGVYAAHTAGAWNGNDPLNLMQDHPVTRTDDASPWSYSPELYWPGSGNVSFFAYAPHQAAGLTLSGTTGTPQMEFSVHSDHSQQVDLLTAIPLKNQTQKSSTDGYASFQLRHALTRISFAAKTSVVTPDAVKITDITINNLYNSGTASMDASNRKWNPTGTADATYTLNATNNGGLNNQELTPDYQTITSATGNLFLMPQTLSDNATLHISFTNNGVVVKPVEIQLALALAQWQPGEAIRFLINLEATDPNKPFDVELDYTFVPWDNLDTDVEIDKDPFLYVTDISTSSFDAAATRIYFYTNKAPADVYIDPIGRISSINGPTVNVKDEFYALAKGDPDGTTNFHFDGTTQQGWIDLINLNTSTTGTKQPLIIKLCAGNLERYITVQPVVTTEIANKNSTRYIGTFHRHNEMGERIITWHLENTVLWTATIDPSVGNHADLSIDRMASPDYKDNLLYSFLPRKAEGAKVEPYTTVSGKGRLYFRVGWKNTSPNANRYARIRIDYSGTGAPTQPDYIYCRQGENPDDLAPNTATYNFTVYNLAGDGIFVEYPSQGGFISQWGRPRLWPLIGEAAPAGYPLIENTEDIDPDVNICPERYTYLNQLAIGEIQGALLYLNPQWGYYADGFFDRRAIANDRVDNTSISVGSAGILLSVATNSHSVFIPTAGYRDQTGLLQGIGKVGGYWSGYHEAPDSPNAIAIKVFEGFTAQDIKAYDKRNSLFLRCIQIPNAVVLSFDANGGENAPRSVSTESGTEARIPSNAPDNYWKENYIFEGWATQKDGGGTLHQPATLFQMGTEDQTLYAKWVADLYRLNFRSYLSESLQSVYLLPTTGPLTSYNDYDIGNNGEKLPTPTYLWTSDATTVANLEKAYGNLEFHKEMKKGTWSDAYTTCKGLDGGTAGWRLPRTMELMIVGGTVKQEIINVIFPGTEPLWTGTEQNTSNAHRVSKSWNTIAQTEAKANDSNYRCVRELKQ